MPEVIRPILQVNYVCNSCTLGLMYPTGVLLKDSKIEHQCANCGDIAELSKCYPIYAERNGS